jgi:hypothetical protein
LQVRSSGSDLFAGTYEGGIYRLGADSIFSERFVHPQGKQLLSLEAQGEELMAVFQNGDCYYSENAGQSWAMINDKFDNRRALSAGIGDGVLLVTTQGHGVWKSQSPVAALKSKNQSTNGMMIYTNPSSGEFNVAGLNSTSEICIYDINGRCVYAGTKNQIDISNHAKGIYFIEVINSGEVFRKKIILE